MSNSCFYCGERTNVYLPYWGVSVCGKECMAKLKAMTDHAMEHGSRDTLRVVLNQMVTAKEATWLQERTRVEQLILATKPSASVRPSRSYGSESNPAPS